MLARNWKRRWLLLCLVTKWKIVGVMHPTKLRQNLRAFWKLIRQARNGGETNEFKSKLTCILEASESTRLRMEESLPNYHEDHIAGKGDNSLQNYNLVDKFIPMPQAMKIPAAKAAVDKECEKWRNFRRGTWRKSEVRKRWSMKQGRLKGICTVIQKQDYYGKGNLRKSYWSTVGRRFPIGNAYSYIVKKDYSYLCMWMTSNCLERHKTLIRCGKYSTKKSIWENQHLSSIMYTWAALKDNAK